MLFCNIDNCRFLCVILFDVTKQCPMHQQLLSFSKSAFALNNTSSQSNFAIKVLCLCEPFSE